jgi:nucleotide-binding universal stress UspA family protein
MFKKIVVGLDGSEPANHALRMACDIAKKYGSEMHLVHTPKAETVAFALGAVAGYHAVTTMPDAETVREAAQKVLSEAETVASKFQPKSVTTHIGSNEPADDVIKCANDTGADLIVTGRRGLGSVSAAILGSTSQRVSHLAQCAHLTVT